MSRTGGEQLGHYRLGRLIGAGGMGEVYLARDLVLGRDVAIKFVTSNEAANPTLRARLLQEAQAVAALDHPCICPVHDVGVAPDGRPYMVMQYVEGQTLASRLAQGALPVRDALTLCGHIADALAAAHRRGVIHRDLKPQNVMVTPGGQPKLLDFGIAKLLPPSDAATTTAEGAVALTGTHDLVGTPSYMSPEQVQQRRLDGRSDLFSLGAILFECLTGQRPFTGLQPIDVMGRILHVHPPAPSELRPDLDERHDELCRRLLAKEPNDRFQSADEVVGALRLLQPDTARTPPSGSIRGPALLEPTGMRSWIRRNARLVLAAGVVIAVAAIGLRQWLTTSLPSPPPEALRSYQRGTEWLREGAFHSAAAALEEALRLFPDYGIAYARLAEARAEIDDKDAAEQALLRLSEHVKNESRLPRDEQLRLQAIRFVVLRDVDRAVDAYRELAQRNPADAGAWLDLGRAQETAGQLTDAQASYERAVANDGQYAAAHLRLGMTLAAVGRRTESLKAYEEAGRLYRASSNTEGQAEVLIRQGTLFDRGGAFRQARDALEQALSLARNSQNKFQIIRSQLQLSSVTASEGRSADSERIASDAVKSALESGLDTIAAGGLIDLAATLNEAGRPQDAELQIRRAADLADKRGARRIASRARLQMASLRLSQSRPSDALAELTPALKFFKEHNYRHYELQALTIASRAYQDLDDFARAHALATDVLRVADGMQDSIQEGLALGTLALQATTLGSLPEALNLRERAEAIHRGQKDDFQLPFDLTNRAEVLIRIGRLTDAEKALAEVQQGIEKRIEAYVGRQRRVTFLRTLAAVVAGRFDQAVQFGAALRPDPSGTDSASVLGPALVQYSEARLRTRSAKALTPAPGSTQPRVPHYLARERQYWRAATDLARGRDREALAAASEGLQQASRIVNEELEWRLAAIGSVAARALGGTEQHRALRAQAFDALMRLRKKWGDHARAYEQRPDLIQLRADAGL